VRLSHAVSRDRAGVIRALAGMRPLVMHRYLEEERGIPRSLLEHPRFAGRLLVDARSNVIFPHADRDGPCARRCQGLERCASACEQGGPCNRLIGFRGAFPSSPVAQSLPGTSLRC
jgi:hypothetical protein